MDVPTGFTLKLEESQIFENLRFLVHRIDIVHARAHLHVRHARYVYVRVIRAVRAAPAQKAIQVYSSELE